MDALGAREAYLYGYYGIPDKLLTGYEAFHTDLTEAQQQAIYEIGQRARDRQLEAQWQKAQEKRNAADVTGVEEVVNPEEEDLHVEESGNRDRMEKGTTTEANTGALSGALTSKNDPDAKKREAFADLYYAEVLGRKREYEIAAVARNSGFDETDVSKIFAHVFELEHLFSDGSIHKFHTDYDMAQSWIRLREGKNIQAHDIILLKHEQMEAEIMGTDTTVPYELAHEEVSKVYDYKAALIKYLKENNLE